MSKLKILFADDQIPNETVPDHKVIAELKKYYPLNEWLSKRLTKEQYEEWIGDFPKMRQAVSVLRDAGYEVDVARTSEEAQSLINKNHYDLAIVDLNWWGDKAIDEQKKLAYGYQICNAIDEANNRKHLAFTHEIIYSSRFEREAELSTDAAREGKLPLVKKKSEAGHQNLKATVMFLESLINSSNPEVIERKRQEDSLDEVKKHWDDLRNQLKQWFALTIAFVAIGFAVILGGVVGVMLGNVEVGAITAAGGAVTTAASGLLFKQLQKLQDLVEKRAQDWMNLYKKP